MSKKFDLSLFNKEIEKMIILQEYSYHHSSLTEEDEEEDVVDSEIEDIEVDDNEPLPDEPTIEDVPNSDEFETDMGLQNNEIDSNVEEVDITDLKNDIEIIKQSIDNNIKFTDSISQALEKLNYIETKLGEIDNLNSKIDSLEVEIEERNPTPVEKLELSSLNSFPYNTKLSSYFEDIDNNTNYDINVNKISDSDGEKEISYELTDDDIRNGYNDYEIRNSF